MTDQTSADDVARAIADQFSDNWTTRNFMAARITAVLQAERARVIEECARIAQDWTGCFYIWRREQGCAHRKLAVPVKGGIHIAAAIRAMTSAGTAGRGK